MRTLKLPLYFLFVLLPLFSIAQANPFLKKYAGAYHRLNFGEQTPTATTEKITLTADGKWTSISFPTDENGVTAKVPVKKSGIWKASEYTIQIVSVQNGTSVEEAYNYEDGLLMGSNKYLVKVFDSNPAFQVKYAGQYHLIHGNEDQPHAFTPTITLKADGKCSRSTPTTDSQGGMSKTPTIASGSWKAQDGVIRITFPSDGSEGTYEFKTENAVFTNHVGSRLKKVVPPPPPGLYLGKYAGIYNMVGEGQPVTKTSDKYVLKPDGTGTWSFYIPIDQQGTLSKTPTVINGTWKASEGLIQIYFSPPDAGGEGSEMLNDFKFVNGAFRAEGVMLKKLVPPTPVKK